VAGLAFGLLNLLTSRARAGFGEVRRLMLRGRISLQTLEDSIMGPWRRTGLPL